MTERRERDIDQRNAEILQVLGGFLVILSVAVLAGTLWGVGTVPRLINFAAGVMLAAIGAGMIWRGRVSAHAANEERMDATHQGDDR